MRMTSSCTAGDVTMTAMVTILSSIYLVAVPAAEAVNGAEHIASETGQGLVPESKCSTIVFNSEF